MPSPQYFKGKFYQLAGQACVIDVTPPTFSGIASVVPNNAGDFTINWSAATSTKTPVRYEIYVSLGVVSAAALFVTANRVGFAPGLLTSWKVNTLRDQITYFINGLTYTFGVRAVDSQNFSDSNVVVLTSTAIASGNIGGVFQATEAAFAATELLLAADHVNFQSDHTNFMADHANFVADLATFGTDLATFNTYLGTLAADLTTLGADLATLASISSALSATASAIAATEILLASDEAAFAANNVTFSTHLTTLAADLVTLAGYLTTLGMDITQINSIIADLEILANTLASARAIGDATVVTLSDDPVVVTVSDDPIDGIV